MKNSMKGSISRFIELEIDFCVAQLGPEVVGAVARPRGMRIIVLIRLLVRRLVAGNEEQRKE